MRKNKHHSLKLDYSVQTDGRLRQAQLRMLDILKEVDRICLKHQLDYWLDRGSLLGAVRHQGFIPWDDDIDVAMPRKSYEAFLQIAPEELSKSLCLQTRFTEPGYFNLAAPLKIRDKNSLFLEKHEQGDEPYSQGIFIDVFPYDDVSENPKPYLRNKWISKKILRLLSHKYSKVTMGHYAGLYKCISHSVSKSFLESFLQNMHQKNKKEDGSFLGYGYDSTKKGYFTKLDIYPLKRIKFEQTYFNAPNHSEKVLQTIYGDYLTLPLEERRKLNHCKQLILDISA